MEQSLTEDPVIRISIKFLKTKWPFSSPRRDLLYLLYRSKALCVVDSCLVFDERVVIWATFKQRVLQQFPFSHLGINQMKTFSGRYANWLGMNKDIELLLEVALNVKNAARGPPREKPISWFPTKTSWSRIHVDFDDPINGVA